MRNLAFVALMALAACAPSDCDVVTDTACADTGVCLTDSADTASTGLTEDSADTGDSSALDTSDSDTDTDTDTDA